MGQTGSDTAGPRADLKRFGPEIDADTLAKTLAVDGAAIVEDVLSADVLATVNDELSPWIEATGPGKDGFTGHQTHRTGALVARSPACRDVVMHPLILGAAGAFLSPFAEKIQLHLTQVITIDPGQGTQPLHRDRLAWGGYIPREIEPQFNTIWALTDFTDSNGATRVVPGSPGWDDDRRPEDHEKTQAVMTAGSVLLYSGSVIHGGGENRSTEPRRGMNITYTLGWLRTEENQYLSCPPHIAKDLDPELQELLGYTMGSYALGYYSEPGEVRGNDLHPPERALGRRPRPMDTPMIG
jgi:ectoine hydroxylase-related dioxygenase (phytanoyl-CoA dioxygenase family)